MVIAHRLSTIRNADRILLLAPINGAARLVEEGTHEQLLARGGIYYHLYMLQFHEKQELHIPTRKA
jgi:subfamily B ATP-binding cassette protein MsbA